MVIVFGIPGFSTDAQSAEGKRLRQAIATCSRAVGSHKFVMQNGSTQAVAFTIDDAFNPRSSDRENAAALAALMACLVECNRIWLRYHPATPPLYHTPVYYRRTTLWDTVPCLYARGWGDCKSLAAARVAENDRDGIVSRTVFRFLPGKTGTMFHILVMYADGRWEDPSKALGMESVQEQPDHASNLYTGAMS